MNLVNTVFSNEKLLCRQVRQENSGSLSLISLRKMQGGEACFFWAAGADFICLVWKWLLDLLSI